MKIAIIYSTNIRATKKAAKILSSKLNCQTQLIPIEKAKTACLLKYDYIILAGSINNGNVQGVLKRYISRNLKTLMEKPTAVIDSAGNELSYGGLVEFSEELVKSSFLKSNFGTEINKDEGNFFEKRYKTRMISKYEKEGKNLPVLNLNEINQFADHINRVIDERI